MNPLDIEIARYIQTAELSFHFSAESDEHEFAYQFQIARSGTVIS